jgi:hypothetical protein
MSKQPAPEVTKEPVAAPTLAAYPPQAPPYPGQPSAPYAQPVENPGQTLGIIGLVLNFIGISIGGIILGVMSRNKSKSVNMSTTLGTVSLVWGIIATAFAILGIILFTIIIVIAIASEPSTTPSYFDSPSSYFN